MPSTAACQAGDHVLSWRGRRVKAAACSARVSSACRLLARVRELEAGEQRLQALEASLAAAATAEAAEAAAGAAAAAERAAGAAAAAAAAEAAPEADAKRGASNSGSEAGSAAAAGDATALFNPDWVPPNAALASASI
jgi:Tfp pilus assembly protein FimV